ncbi:hypothetical protein FOCC_FOCC012259, partial [Frankliniella occidentalis]
MTGAHHPARSERTRTFCRARVKDSPVQIRLRFASLAATVPCLRPAPACCQFSARPTNHPQSILHFFLSYALKSTPAPFLPSLPLSQILLSPSLVLPSFSSPDPVRPTYPSDVV